MSQPELNVTFARSARKELEELQSNVANRVWTKIESLKKDPRPSGCRKLQGEKHLWRIRIGDYRVIYSVYDKERIIDIIAVRHRSKAYGAL